MPKYYLDFTNEKDECCAAFLAILAYAEITDNEDMRADVHASLCRLHYQSLSEHDETWSITPQSIKPIHAFRDQKLINRDLRQLKRRLRDRMVAAKIAMPFLQEVALGHLPELPKGLKRLSLNEMCQHVLSDSGQTEPENVETRIWRKSLPIIHLATATAVAIDQLEKSGLAKPSIGHLLIYPDLVRNIVETSHEHASLLLKSKRLSINPEALIQIFCR